MLLLAALALAGCLPTQATFDVGLGTSRITGFLTAAEDDARPAEPLVVVIQQHHQFVTHADGSAVLRPGAQVLQPGREGAFVIHVPGDVVAMDVLFIAPGHLTQVFHFRRQLGIGDIQYRARLAAMPDWRSHYFTFLTPQLEHLITEPRYRLDPAGQRLLGEWLHGQNSRLAGAPRGAEPAQGDVPATESRN